VPQQIRHRFDVRSGFQPRHRRRVPQRVNTNAVGTNMLGGGLDHPKQVPWIDRPTELRGEHQTGALPLVPSREPLLGLGDLVPFEERHDPRMQGHDPP
jgi:hypothetical protein